MKTFTLWPAVIVLSAAVAGSLVLTNTGGPVRIAIVMWFMLVCPGMMLVRYLRLREPLLEWTLAVTLSLVVDTFIAGIMLIARDWSPLGALTIILSVTVAGAVATEAQVVRAWLSWGLWSLRDSPDFWDSDDSWDSWNSDDSWDSWGGWNSQSAWSFWGTKE